MNEPQLKKPYFKWLVPTRGCRQDTKKSIFQYFVKNPYNSH